MRTYQLKNPYFAHGWADWTLTRTNGDVFLNTVDSVKYGLMTGRESPTGMPTVGNSYMLLARQAEVSGAASDVNSVDIITQTTYDIAEGDILVADIHFQFDNKSGVSLSHPSGIEFRSSVDYSSVLYPTLQNSYAGDTVYRQRLAWRSPSDQSIQLGVGVTITDITSVTNTFYFNWIGVDNIQIFSALDHLTVADANDTTGVT